MLGGSPLGAARLERRRRAREFSPKSQPRAAAARLGSATWSRASAAAPNRNVKRAPRCRSQRLSGASFSSKPRALLIRICSQERILLAAKASEGSETLTCTRKEKHASVTSHKESFGAAASEKSMTFRSVPWSATGQSGSRRCGLNARPKTSQENEEADALPKAHEQH